MHSDDFNSYVEAQINFCRATLIDKAQEYATEDRLHNFRVAARLQGVTPIRALSGMMAKHTISIYDMCEDAESYPLGVWEEKITDHINYLLLLKAMVSERPKKGTVTSLLYPTHNIHALKPDRPDKVVYREGGKEFIGTDNNDHSWKG